METSVDGEQAFGRLCHEEFDLVLCDCLTPKMNGMQLFEKLKQTKPSLLERFIFVSGCSADKAFDDFIRQNNVLRVTKPFVPDQLVDLVIKKLSAF